MPDERYKDTILQALPAEYERVRIVSYDMRDCHLAEIRRTMTTLYAPCNSTVSPVRTTFPRSQVVRLLCKRPEEAIAQQLQLLRQSGTPPETLRHLDSGPTQWGKSARGSFDTVRVLEREERNRRQAGVVLVSLVNHEQRRSTPHATTEQQMGDNGSANCASQRSEYHTVLTPSDPAPGSNLERQGKSFVAVKCLPKTCKRKSNVYGRSVTSMNRLPRSTLVGYSATLEAPQARRLGDRLSRSRNGRDLGL